MFRAVESLLDCRPSSRPRCFDSVELQTKKLLEGLDIFRLHPRCLMCFKSCVDHEMNSFHNSRWPGYEQTEPHVRFWYFQ